MIWLLLAWVTDRAQMCIAARNYGTKFNGIGAIDSVLAKTADAPMAYRVLVPWIVGLLERIWPGLRPWRMAAVYEPLKIGLMALAFWSAERAIGMQGALMVVVLLNTSWEFEYWSWAPELAGVALALTGNLPLAAFGGMLAALSKPETSPLVAVTYPLVTRDWPGTAIMAICIGVPWLAARLWAGHHKLYCERWTWRKNWERLVNMRKMRPAYMSNMAMSLIVTALTLLVVITGRAGPAWPVPLLYLAAGWTVALMAETRVVAPCLIWIAMGLSGG